MKSYFVEFEQVPKPTQQTNTCSNSKLKAVNLSIQWRRQLTTL